MPCREFDDSLALTADEQLPAHEQRIGALAGGLVEHGDDFRGTPNGGRMSSTPSACAASRSRSPSFVDGSVVSVSASTRTMPGAVSRSSCKCFGPICTCRALVPSRSRRAVTGLRRTRPGLDRPRQRKHRDRARCVERRSDRAIPRCRHDQVHREARQLTRQYGELVVRRSPTLLECDGLAFLVPKLAQAVAQSLELGC